MLTRAQFTWFNVSTESIIHLNTMYLSFQMRKLVVMFLIFKIHLIFRSESSCLNCSCQNDRIRCQPQQDNFTTELCLTNQTCANAIQIEIINIKKLVLTNNLFQNFQAQMLPSRKTRAHK